MKLTLKLLLFLCVLLAGAFAATPLWLPWFFSSMLPAGWQLERLQTGYPGISGINITALHVKGGHMASSVDLAATDIIFTYRGLKSNIGSVSLDIFISTPEDLPYDKATLDDFSLPITKLTGKLPELSISQLELSLRLAQNVAPANGSSSGVVELHLTELKLLPVNDNSFHLTSAVMMNSEADLRGQLDINVNPGSLRADIRFPAATESVPWLKVSLEQTDQATQTTTQVHAMVDAGAAHNQWLNSLLALYTDDDISLMGGKLQASLDFAGRELQAIEAISLSAGQFQAGLADGVLNLDFDLLAQRDGQQIIVTLPANAEIRYQDNKDSIENMVKTVIPGLNRTPQADTLALLKLAAASTLVFEPNIDSTMKFNGSIKLDVRSTNSNFSLDAPELHLEIPDFSRPDSTVVNGLINISWQEGSPFSYLYSEDGSNPVALMADWLDIQAQLGPVDGNWFSTGGGIISGGRIQAHGVTTKKVDISWQNLDMLSLTGKLNTRTYGLRSKLDGKVWAGFDLDLGYTLLNQAEIDGTGTILFDSGPDLPIKFAGNTVTQRWNITLPATTIKLSQLGSIMTAAHYKLPASVKLTGGYIDIEGDIHSDPRAVDEITARMLIKGHELDLSILESHVQQASFNFDTSYGSSITAMGPVSIDSIALAGGFDVTNIRMDLGVENIETFSIENLVAELFDGQLSLDILHFEQNRVADSHAELSHINLGRLLEFVDVDGLQGSGFLDITLPTGSDQTGIYVKGGSFRSREPGHLAYTKEGVAGSNIGLQALENFQYQSLSGNIDYQSDGNYQISVRLEGKNPDLYGGHPIVFNLKISGSLPELFEALFITGSFEESILKEIRSR